MRPPLSREPGNSLLSDLAASPEGCGQLQVKMCNGVIRREEARDLEGVGNKRKVGSEARGWWVVPGLPGVDEAPLTRE